MIKIDIPIVDEKDIILEKEKGRLGAIFVVHEHQASHYHWDLRLEMEGVLKSWAVPKDPGDVNKGIKRLAIQVEDHDIEYADFEGIIPQGMYGAGTVKIYDRGEFVLQDKNSSRILFELKGKKLNGKYILTRFRENWLFFKRG